MSQYIDSRYVKNLDKCSKPVYKVSVEKDIPVTMRDGVRVLVDIFRPDVIAQEKFPALLAISPFGKDVQEMARWLPPQPNRSAMTDACLEAGDINYLVSRGYVFITCDPRGIGRSEGEYVGIFGSMAQDGYDVVEWAAEQPWCNGSVGMMGICIFSASQLLVAGEQPPHLKAITPFDIFGDLYRDMIYHGGVLFSLMHAAYSGHNMNDSGLTRGNVNSIMLKTCSKEEIDRLTEEAANRPELRYNSRFYSIVRYPMTDPSFFDFLLNPNDGPFWDELSPSSRYDRIKVPVYAGSPWLAPSFIWPIFRIYDALKAPLRLLISPPRGLDRPFHEFHDELVRWFDYHLKGVDTGIMDEPPIKMFVMGANRWRYESEWPLARTRWTKAYLRSFGRMLAEAPATEEPPDGFTQPAALTTSNVYSVEYKTPPFAEDTDVTGPVTLYLHAAIDSEDTTFIADLKDVDPAGNETLLGLGYLRASHRALDPVKSKPYKPYHPHRISEPVVPGQVYEYAIEFTPIANVFRAGHCLKLVIRSQDNLMELRAAWGVYHLPNATTVSHNIYHDRRNPSYLLLPIIPRTDASQWLTGGDIGVEADGLPTL
ncbi:MAG: CocE/NonD family hydrolase [Chloroflexi bacterium]|nr:CocE/NonD family hydrolase [Chloroflexota bacterium]